MIRIDRSCDGYGHGCGHGCVVCDVMCCGLLRGACCCCVSCTVVLFVALILLPLLSKSSCFHQAKKRANPLQQCNPSTLLQPHPMIIPSHPPHSPPPLPSNPLPSNPTSTRSFALQIKKKRRPIRASQRRSDGSTKHTKLPQRIEL